MLFNTWGAGIKAPTSIIIGFEREKKMKAALISLRDNHINRVIIQRAFILFLFWIE